MAILGIDLGTSTLSAVVLDEKTRAVLHSETHKGAGFAALPESWARVQDADALADMGSAVYERLSKSYALSAVALTGQMHGVVPVDESGLAVGPLYTWQDGRGALTENGESVCDVLSRETGLSVASGYGLATHVYNLRHNLTDPRTRALTTAAGYLGMRLTGRKRPLLHASDAASLGGYDVRTHRFLDAAVRLSENALPESVDQAVWLGKTRDHVPVAVAIGDNQASFIGASDEPERTLLVNVGTGSQVSLCADRCVLSDAFDTRPFIDGSYLLVSSPLCGGKSYALLERFLRSCAALAGCDESKSLYGAMNVLAMVEPRDPLTVDTRFCGTRRDPSLRASITNLGEDNFDAAHLIRGVLTGMARELFDGYAAMCAALPVRSDLVLTASGNGAKRNPALQSILAQTFGRPLTLSPYDEEAARGAAIFALGLLEEGR